MSIINQIVSRCHVGNSDLFVIRYTVSRLKNKYKTFKSMPREKRRELMTEIIKAHAENRRLYRQAMS